MHIKSQTDFLPQSQFIVKNREIHASAIQIAHAFSYPYSFIHYYCVLLCIWWVSYIAHTQQHTSIFLRITHKKHRKTLIWVLKFRGCKKVKTFYNLRKLQFFKNSKFYNSTQKVQFYSTWLLYHEKQAKHHMFTSKPPRHINIQWQQIQHNKKLYNKKLF